MSKRTNLKARLVKTLILLTMGCTSLASQVIYVDDNADGANNGSSWENAYNYLQDAISTATAGDDILVAQGIYKPDQGIGVTPGDRRASFHLKSGVTITGGYAGSGSPEPDTRDVGLFQTILSGDLNGDDIDVNDPCDLRNEPSRVDNSSHIVTGSNTNATAVLNGFTITGGYISVIAYRLGGGPSGGAGMLISSGSPTLINCTFTDNLTANSGGGLLIYGDSNPTLLNCNFTRNYAESGGGIFNSTSKNLTLINCTLNDNYAQHKGGGIYNVSGNPILTNCTFRRNSTYGSSNKGGGMYNRNGSPVLTNCTFSENSAAIGGGIYNEDGNTMMNMCEFVMNIASHYGGAMSNNGGQPVTQGCVFVKNYQGAVHDYSKIGSIFTNCISIGNSSRGRAGALNVNKATVSHCLFAGNRAFGSGSTGGAAFNFNTAAFNNCTFSDNWAEFGNAIYCFGIADINNCIFWGSEDQIHVDDPYAAPTFVRYSNVQGGWSGEGNINVDPLFVDPGYWADANDPNVAVEPNDPNAVWIDGDYHLKSQAGRWDPASESWVVDDATSPCIDAGDPNTPIGHEPFPNGGIINMGAYGGTAQASKSYFGGPACETIIAGDINGDCKVDFDDIMILMAHWLQDYTPQD